ncbi:MAG: thioredoxin domain-containing protein [Planctomycetaceae bacterium]
MRSRGCADVATEIAAANQVGPRTAILAYMQGRELERYLGKLDAPMVQHWLKGVAEAVQQRLDAALTVEEIELTEANFDATIEGESLPVLVDVWAEWCGPCKMLAPSIRRVATEYEGRLVVGKLDADTHPAIARRYIREGIPLLLLFHEGKLVDRIEGALPLEHLREWIDEGLARIKAPAAVKPTP